MDMKEAIARIKEHTRIHARKEAFAVHITEALVMAVEALERQVWIPVEERLPEIQQRILVYCESKTIKKHITVCTYMGGYLGHKQFSRHVRNVTHWMPLPEPPKGE